MTGFPGDLPKHLTEPRRCYRAPLRTRTAGFPSTSRPHPFTLTCAQPLRRCHRTRCGKPPGLYVMTVGARVIEVFGAWIDFLLSMPLTLTLSPQAGRGGREHRTSNIHIKSDVCRRMVTECEATSFSPSQRGEGARRADEGLIYPRFWPQQHLRHPGRLKADPG